MKRNLFNLVKYYSLSTNVSPKICIVGAGPAGFYAAQHIVKHNPLCRVDLYEKLPVPFGLVRYGVAPDHPEVKNVINTFTKTALNPQVRFVGNVELGKDILLKELQEAYNAVLLTYGADENRCLNIPGEDLPNVFPARRIVGWYNGIPWDKDLNLDLTGNSATIFGQGNVAIDIARILLTPIDQLKKTDITQHSLEQLSRSKIKKVYLIGRRGPLQAAFTIKELREMLKLENCCTTWNISDFNGIPDIVPNLQRPKKRIIELMLKSIQDSSVTGTNKFLPIFFRSPIEIIGDKKVEKVKLAITALKGDDIFKQQAILTDKTEILESDLAITSIGYKSIQADKDIPFDLQKGIVDNANGQINNGLYASGWLATGPTGVILTTMSNAFTTADLVCKEIQSKHINKPGYEYILNLLQNRNVPLVNWDGWMKIDECEKQEGMKIGKPREKILDVNKMLEIAC